MVTRQYEQGPDVTPITGAHYGERIAAALARVGEDRAWLARTMGVRWQTVSDWISGKREPRGGNLRALAEVLRVSPDELLGVIDGQEPPFPAWAQFVELVKDSITDRERRALAAIPWPVGTQPTVPAYQTALLSLRLTIPRE